MQRWKYTLDLPKPVEKMKRERAELMRMNLNLESDTPRLENEGPMQTWGNTFVAEKVQSYITTDRLVRDRMTPLVMSKPNLLVTTKNAMVRGPSISPVQTP